MANMKNLNYALIPRKLFIAIFSHAALGLCHKFVEEPRDILLSHWSRRSKFENTPGVLQMLTRVQF
jgi:hypothetical protein